MSSSLGGYRGPAGVSVGNNQAGMSMMKEKVPSGYKKGQLNNYTPEQMQLFQQMFSHAGPESYLSRLAGGDQSLFEEMEAPAMRQFNQLQGQNASRFSGMGMGARRGSGFQNSQNQITSDFAQDLQANRQNLQRQALQDLRGLSGELLGQRPYEQFLVPKQQKQGVDWSGLAGAGVGGIGGFFAGGPMGALTGASIGYGVGSGKGSNTQFKSSPGYNGSTNNNGYNFAKEMQSGSGYFY